MRTIYYVHLGSRYLSMSFRCCEDVTSLDYTLRPRDAMNFDCRDTQDSAWKLGLATNSGSHGSKVPPAELASTAA